MKRIIIIFSAVIAAILAVGIAYASIPAADGTINGCYKNANGDLIVIDSAATCPTGHTALNWNQTGPAGPPGQSGVTSFYTVTEVVPLLILEPPVTGEITCLSGDAVTGVAAVIDAPYAGRPNHRLEILPTNGTNPNGAGWSISSGDGAEGYNAVFRIVCADLP